MLMRIAVAYRCRFCSWRPVTLCDTDAYCCRLLTAAFVVAAPPLVLMPRYAAAYCRRLVLLSLVLPPVDDAKC